ncbi:DinB family protein [Mucilaginibacter sp. OK098]|uniref:DinB family protein n=1 Tax=Mucilaginibacter sp. OK098 TaxID=1855297 RepID=UPI0009207537|nr:DinB family protein [Mucilaginibacter sp. OK098]SHM53711.1 DinB superfamily protein [Mucilaginibacter sp. OK098]
MRIIPKPLEGEYPPYTIMYIKLIPGDGMVLQHLWDNFITAKELVYSMPEKMLYHRYAEGKWSIKETLVHIIDDERIFAYRALRFARNEQMNLIGFDQDAYTLYSKADERNLDNIFDEYEAVRKSTIALFNGLPEDAFMRIGKGTGTFNNASVRALAYHIAGHEQHHINLIKELYIPSFNK